MSNINTIASGSTTLSMQTYTPDDGCGVFLIGKLEVSGFDNRYGEWRAVDCLDGDRPEYGFDSEKKAPYTRLEAVDKARQIAMGYWRDIMRMPGKEVGENG